MRIHKQRVDPIEMPPQPLQRRHSRIGQKLAPRLIGAIALDDLYAERLFAFEMIVERALRHAGSVGNALHADGVKAFFDQAFEAGLDNLFAGIRSWQEYNMTGRLKTQEGPGLPIEAGSCGYRS